MSSVYNKLDKIRKPRVQIKYEVETDGASEQKELPFVVGVLGDYSGNNPGVEKDELKKREFTQIDQDNFDDVMQKIRPGVSLKVENKLGDEPSHLAIDLEFNSMDDFTPDHIVQKIPQLRDLIETRNQLQDLASKSDISSELESILEEVLTNSEKMEELEGGQDSTPSE